MRKTAKDSEECKKTEKNIKLKIENEQEKNCLAC